MRSNLNTKAGECKYTERHDMKSYTISNSGSKFTSTSCSQDKTAEMHRPLGEVIYWLGLCKWPRADSFLGTGFDLKEKKHVSQRQLSLSLIFCPCPPLPRMRAQKTVPASTLQPLTGTPSRMDVSKSASPGQHYEVLLGFGFCYHLCFLTHTLLFSLSCVAFLTLLHFFQSTILRVISWPIVVEPCSSRRGQLHGVPFLLPTVFFNVTRSFEGKNQEEKECWSQETRVPGLLWTIWVNHFVCLWLILKTGSSILIA